MAAFTSRSKRLLLSVNCVIVIVIYTASIIYIFRCKDDQHFTPVSLHDSLTSGALGGEGAAVDERQQHQPNDQPLSQSNSSPTNNNNSTYGDDDDDDDREREGTVEEFVPQSSDAEANHNEATIKGIANKDIRLLCWILTDPKILHKSSEPRDTWMQDCDVRLFMSSEEDKEFPAIGLNVSAGREHIAEKSRAAWTYVYENHRSDAEFFVKADPDSYVVVENLKRYLANCDPNEPAIYGHNLYYNQTGVHYVAGEAVVLGRESLNRLVTKAILLPGCYPKGESEDVKTCECLAMVGGYTVDTRDEIGRETFLPPFSLQHITKAMLPDWYKKTYRQPYGFCESINCLSNYPIVFHYVGRADFYLMNYLIRNLQSKSSEDHPRFRFNSTRYFSQKKKSTSS